MNLLKTEIIFVWFLWILCSGKVQAQNIYVQSQQSLSFGEFVLTNEAPGIISISDSGEWSSSGNVQLLSSNYHPAIFILSTDHSQSIKVQVEVEYHGLEGADNKHIPFAVAFEDLGVFTIVEDSPALVMVGGSIKINSRLTSSEEKFSGNISLRVSILED